MILDTRGMGKGKPEQKYLLVHVQVLLVHVAPWGLITGRDLSNVALVVLKKNFIGMEMSPGGLLGLC